MENQCSSSGCFFGGVCGSGCLWWVFVGVGVFQGVSVCLGCSGWGSRGLVVGFNFGLAGQKRPEM